MKQIAVYSLVICMFMLAGCPAKTLHSIDNGSYEAPSWLPGKWVELDKDGQKKDIFLLKKDGHQGHLTCYEVDSSGKADHSKPSPVIMSTIGGKTFLCFYDKGDDASDKGYYLFQFRKVSNTEFILAAIKENLIDYDAESSEIVKFLEQNKDDESIYNPDETVHYKKL